MRTVTKLERRRIMEKSNMYNEKDLVPRASSP